MAGFTLTSTIDLPENPIYWVQAYGLNYSYNDGTGGETVVTYALAQSGVNPRGEAYRTLTAAEITNIENSIAAVTQYANITFVEGAAGDADILIGASSDPDGAAYGRTFFSTTEAVEVVAYDYVYSTENGLANNGYIYMHELLHGLGLNHSAVPFNPSGLIGDDENDGTTLFGSWVVGYDLEIQIFDIAVTQYLYGVDPAMRSGDDTYTPVLATYDPAGDDSDSPLLWDGAGFDTLDFSAQTGDINASLAPGHVSQVGTSNTGILEAGTFSINYHTEIEQLLSGSGDDTLAASDFGSTISGGSGEDSITGGGAADHLSGGTNADVLRGGEGADVVEGDSGLDTLVGNAGDDTMLGGTGHDRMFGGSGADDMRGGAHNDTMDGGAGNDVLRGEDGSNDMSGGTGDDKLYGGGLSDMIAGGTGDDTLVGSAGNDSVLGGDDDDILYGNAGADRLDGEDGNDWSSGGNENDLLWGRSGNDTMRGGNGDDRFFGGSDDDLVAGNLGNDTLDGGSGDDKLFGGGDADRMIGNAGSDTMGGGAGADVFVFATVTDSAHSANRDTITDFQSGVDQIDLSGIMSGLAFVASYSGAAGEVRYNSAVGRLYLDIDGDGASDFSVNLTGAPSLVEADLIL